MKEKIATRIKELREFILKHNHHYYTLGAPEIADEEWDKAFKELKDLEEAHPHLKSADSPTNTIGARVLKGFDTIKHSVPMLSLDNVFSLEEFLQWHEKNKKTLGIDNIIYLGELKFDGLSLSLVYEKGKLKSAATRGDGSVGEDVTANAKTIKSIPQTLKDPSVSYLEVRGEVILTHKEFKRLNAEKAKKGETPYANPRNCAAGSLRHSDPEEVRSRNLTFIAYEIAEKMTLSSTIIKTQEEVQKVLKEQGFLIDTHYKILSAEQCPKFFNYWEQNRDKGLGFDIDGLVIKALYTTHQQTLSGTSRVPKWAIAYKFRAQAKKTKLTSITWQVSRTGIVTPTANLEPVQVGGVTISRATLHNLQDANKKDIREGDTVIVERAGDVIPAITGPHICPEHYKLKPLKAPTKCPSCKSKLVVDPTQTFIRCVSETCPAQTTQKIIHFVSRAAMDIENLGEGVIEFLIDSGYVKSIPDLYELHYKADLLAEEKGFGVKSVDKILNSIEESKNVDLDKFIYALGIKHVGHNTSRSLAKVFADLDAISKATMGELLSIPDIGEATAVEIFNFFRDKENKKMIKSLLELGVAPKKEVVQKVKKGAFTGEHILFTGTLEGITRSSAQSLAEEQGGTIETSFNKNVSVLVVGSNPGSKLDKAKQKGIKVITEEEFIVITGVKK